MTQYKCSSYYYFSKQLVLTSYVWQYIRHIAPLQKITSQNFAVESPTSLFIVFTHIIFTVINLHSVPRFLLRAGMHVIYLSLAILVTI